MPVISCYDDNCIFKSVNQFIISAGYSEDKNIFIIDGHLDLHRINKAYTFGVYCKVYYDVNKNTIVYSDLKLNTMSWEKIFICYLELIIKINHRVQI